MGHTLPAPDAESLGQWFTTMADSGSLVKYLETFDHTVAVMQRADHLSRVARECVEDLAADGVATLTIDRPEKRNAMTYAMLAEFTAKAKAVRTAVGEVSSYLGNTPTVAKGSYIDPRLIDLKTAAEMRDLSG